MSVMQEKPSRTRCYAHLRLPKRRNNMLPATAERVKGNTPEPFNERIRHQTEQNVARYGASGPATIDRRLAELDAEWDIERCVETMAPSFTLLGLGLGLTVDKRWLALPIIVQTFFLQHALQGWCPPIPFLRWLGVRTISEIEEERYALKALRGDFEDTPDQNGRSLRAHAAVQAARK